MAVPAKETLSNPCCLLPLVAAKFTIFGTPLRGIPQPFACRSSSPKNLLDFSGTPYFPFIRGLKRSTGRTAVPIPDRHRSGRRRFSFSICRPVVFGWIWQDGITILPSPLATPPFTQGRLRSALPVIPLPSFLQQVAENPPSPLGRLIASEKCEGTFCTLHYALCIERNPSTALRTPPFAQGRLPSGNPFFGRILSAPTVF